MATQTYQRKNVHQDFDLSFSRNPLTNDVSKKTDVNAINQSLHNLFSTTYYERPFRPTIGANLRKLLFEPADNITIIDMRAAIEETIINNEPRINIRDIKIFDVSDKNAYVVSIEYSIVSTRETKELKITLKRLR